MGDWLLLTSSTSTKYLNKFNMSEVAHDFALYAKQKVLFCIFRTKNKFSNIRKLYRNEKGKGVT